MNKKIFFIILLILFIKTIQAEINIETASEQEIKAAFIIKFTHFVKWPKKAFYSNKDEFIIAILGKHSFGNLFDPFIGKRIFGKRISIVEISNIDKFEHAHILYIGPGEKNNFSKIFNKINNKNILTIGDTKGFAHMGCIINFIQKKENIGFEINIDAINKTNLKISSELLRLARIIQEK